MPLKQIRLELARTKEFPEGSKKHGYEFVAPLDKDGHLDMDEWKKVGQACIVHRFWDREDDEHGQLIHSRRGWAFSYEVGDDDDESLFKFDRHTFKEGEYVGITEHDGVTRPFRVAWVRTPPAFAKS